LGVLEKSCGAGFSKTAKIKKSFWAPKGSKTTPCFSVRFRIFQNPPKSAKNASFWILLFFRAPKSLKFLLVEHYLFYLYNRSLGSVFFIKRTLPAFVFFSFLHHGMLYQPSFFLPSAGHSGAQARRQVGRVAAPSTQTGGGHAAQRARRRSVFRTGRLFFYFVYKGGLIKRIYNINDI